MKMKALVAALALSLIGLAMAQPATPNLDKREANQQQRINQGVASGQLNTKEANRDSRAIHKQKHDRQTAASVAGK